MSNRPEGSNGARLVSLSDEKAVQEILGATVLNLWKVVNNLTRLRPSSRERYRVAIFGSARAQPGTFAYDEVKRAGATRLHHFVIASDAFVVVPGGIGTVLETLMIWQLLQVRHVDNVPLILVGKMWTGLVEWARTSMLDPKLALANAEDLRIPQCLETADEAIAVVRDLHEKWKAGR